MNDITTAKPRTDGTWARVVEAIIPRLYTMSLSSDENIWLIEDDAKHKLLRIFYFKMKSSKVKKLQSIRPSTNVQKYSWNRSLITSVSNLYNVLCLGNVGELLANAGYIHNWCLAFTVKKLPQWKSIHWHTHYSYSKYQSLQLTKMSELLTFIIDLFIGLCSRYIKVCIFIEAEMSPEIPTTLITYQSMIHSIP